MTLNGNGAPQQHTQRSLRELNEQAAFLRWSEHEGKADHDTLIDCGMSSQERFEWWRTHMRTNGAAAADQRPDSTEMWRPHLPKIRKHETALRADAERRFGRGEVAEATLRAFERHVEQMLNPQHIHTWKAWERYVDALAG